MTPKKYGILIGINYSVRPKTYLQKYFESLCGAVNDITQAQEYMESHHSFERLRILKSTKTNPQDGKEDPDEPKEQWPSRENIIKAFDDTTEEVVKGDWVYIHYSGHGSRIESIYADIKADSTTQDEILVPYNFNITQDGLRDLELMILLYHLVKKGALITVVLDCCHSGGAMRGGLGDDNTTDLARGLSGEDLFPEELSKKKPDERFVKLAAENLHLFQRASRAVVQSNWVYEQIGYTLLAACRMDQLEYESDVDGKPYGRLANHLFEFLSESSAKEGAGITPQLVHRMIVAKHQKAGYREVPILIEGIGDASFFGSNNNLPPYAVTETGHDYQREPDLCRPECRKGRCHLEGTKYNLFPKRVNPQDTTPPVATVQLDRVQDYTSTGQVVYASHEPSRPDQKAEVTSQARLLSQLLPKKVYIQLANNEGSLKDIRDNWDSYSPQHGLAVNLLGQGEKLDPSILDVLIYLVNIDSDTSNYIVSANDMDDPIPQFPWAPKKQRC